MPSQSSQLPNPCYQSGKKEREEEEKEGRKKGRGWGGVEKNQRKEGRKGRQT